MNKENREGTFIPCGDSMEKMHEINEAELDAISGGAETVPVAKACPRCGKITLPQISSYSIVYFCSACKDIFGPSPDATK